MGVVHFVADVVGAADFLCANLGFTAAASGNDRVVENGALSIRLCLSGDQQPTGRLELEVTTRDLDAASARLEAVRGVSRPYADLQIGAGRVERVLAAPHGIRVRLVRQYTEDELGIIPPLPTTLGWEESAIETVQVLLKSVPLSFRDLARSRVTETAEACAVEEGTVMVNRDVALRALVLATPAFQHPALSDAMLVLGVDRDEVFRSAVLQSSAD